MRVKAQKWMYHYEQWQESGQTQRDYCEKAGVNYSTFKNSRWRFKGQKGYGKFQPVKIIETKEPENIAVLLPYCKIAFSNGDEIVISSAIAMERLKGLMTCLT